VAAAASACTVLPDDRSKCVMMTYDVRTFGEKSAGEAGAMGTRARLPVGGDNRPILTCERDVIAKTDCIEAAASSTSRAILLPVLLTRRRNNETRTPRRTVCCGLPRGNSLGVKENYSVEHILVGCIKL